MNAGDISVIICTRDRSGMLAQCLKSILAGSTAPGEIIVVDQSADTRTAELVRRIPADPLPVRRIPMGPVGLAAARNKGASLAQGEIVAFTDDDCIVRPNWLSVIAREFADPTVSAVCGHTLPANHSDRPRQALLSTLNHSRRRCIARKANPIVIGRGNNMAFRRCCILSLGGFDERIGVGTPLHAGEDLDLLYRLLAAGGSVIHSPDAVVLHAQPDDWQTIVNKKHGYAVSVAAVLGSNALRGDLYAGSLLAGKLLYEFGYLFCGGMLRANRRLASVGWHSFSGSIHGLKFAFTRGPRDNGYREMAAESFLSDGGSLSPSDSAPDELPR